ncbi:type I methionyl aminopeptidase [Candidatus Berkelbacteria bacterium CG_4_9_14_3_um_filter_39_23]|uniref:Methionine aminopeptidase n=2 Tax=Candidatus Berkelbacteria TaxID=1618330 RepID=A0A2M7CIK1_9BACT|nr:type I methionyl aminopeptidase [Candidatus Berkelbacteria bacterium]PIR28107.1 MAG: type I methionyl aminopeptidase [Candidatus Berkelbacteria bacterium CG11_big_fil_rev_8_21_14_0_20_40_23]PIV25448.1 MAG: type I methionyl aminopeptidase [Candidatus Berkelbacteria bacterium CG03_land_8_20_14_0_80_40_36]PIX30431.1 MAG: type I methionyl aminopeptidase [Candidatus Berkelbacteria bacterium CG_4_8_14_3_um_filter_39_27]PIZ28903.1 MAG: type I methionyl aminopeptidase [Candidatus Berkelbacteria bact
MKTKFIKTAKELIYMRISGKILAEIFKGVEKMVKPGVSSIEIEHFIVDKAKKMNVGCSFKGFNGYKYCSCISVNNMVVHNLPGKNRFNSGDIVSIDIGTSYKGFHSDKAVTLAVGKISSERQKLIDTGKKALAEAIKIIKPGIEINKIGEKIQNVIEKNNFFVIRDLAGHGIGQRIHEPPTIYNFKTSYIHTRLQKGMCIAIEPMLGERTGKIKVHKNGWGISTADNSDSCHFEDTIEVAETSARILTR